MVRLILVVVAMAAFAGCKTDTGCDGAMAKEGCPVDAAVRCQMNSQCTNVSSPVCDTTMNSGTCVACTISNPGACGGKTPICSATDQCAACAQHSDCTASNVCLGDGSCALETQVAYVDASATDNTTCSKAMPCQKLMTALGKGRSYIKLRGSFDEAVTINNQNVTLLAEPGTMLTRSTTGAMVQIMGTSVVEIDDLQIIGGTGMNNPGISIPGGSNVTLTLKRAKISGTKDNGITSAGGSITIEAGTISDNQGAGIACSSTTLAVSRSTISGNQGGGISLSGLNAVVDITNNFIHHNGSAGASVGGASLLPLLGGTTPSRFEFNTVVDNQIKDSMLLSGGVICDQTGFAAPNNLFVRNSVGGSTTKSNANTAGACTYPASTTAQTVTGLNFKASESSPYDYHILAGSSVIGKATTPSTVTVDFDNQPRPANAGDQGADQYKP
jgi:hypothetical protein